VRTNIDIDDALMAAALDVARQKTKKATVEEALRLLVRTRAQGRLRALRGKLHWEGSLEELRRDR
jgi:Arc/MetJ family transcription regulator